MDRVPERILKEPVTKRLFDMMLSSVGIVISSPLWAVIALAVKLEDGGPVFYKQERVGKGLKAFPVYKFRSMVPDAEGSTGPVMMSSEEDPRVTKVGKLLRATAMDELPQLLAILKGDMSFVGPKPLRYFFVEKFAEEYPEFLNRYSGLPGLTGLAQIYGRKDSSGMQRLRFDLLYLENRGLLFDLKLIALSFWITFRGRWDYRGRKIRRIRIGNFRLV